MSHCFFTHPFIDGHLDEDPTFSKPEVGRSWLCRGSQRLQAMRSQTLPSSSRAAARVWAPNVP